MSSSLDLIVSIWPLWFLVWHCSVCPTIIYPFQIISRQLFLQAFNHNFPSYHFLYSIRFLSFLLSPVWSWKQGYGFEFLLRLIMNITPIRFLSQSNSHISVMASFWMEVLSNYISINRHNHFKILTIGNCVHPAKLLSPFCTQHLCSTFLKYN